jgi:NCS1 family nucleobase:cation symporter-1
VLNPVSYEPSEVFRYTTASLPAFAVAGVTFYVLTKLVVQRLGLGGYPNTTHRRYN